MPRLMARSIRPSLPSLQSCSARCTSYGSMVRLVAIKVNYGKTYGTTHYPSTSSSAPFSSTSRSLRTTLPSSSVPSFFCFSVDCLWRRLSSIAAALRSMLALYVANSSVVRYYASAYSNRYTIARSRSVHTYISKLNTIVGPISR